MKSFLVTSLSITPFRMFSHCIHNNTVNVGQQIINCNLRQSLTLRRTKSCHSPTRPRDNVSRDVARLHHVLPYSSCLARVIFSADMSCHIRLWRCQDDRMYMWGRGQSKAGPVGSSKRQRGLASELVRVGCDAEMRKLISIIFFQQKSFNRKPSIFLFQ